jgi:putative redox protein
MVTIDIEYQGSLRCTAIHGPSGSVLETDAPTDNQGKGERFSPTDLLATGLGTCMVTIMGIAARARGFDLPGVRVSVSKHMTTTRPRRIARIDVLLRVPSAVADKLSPEERAELERIAHNCPVRLSLREGIEVPVEFQWGD